MTPTILIVDDDPAMLDALEQALREEGYQTCRASDGIAALQILAEHVIDLVLTDVVLPGLDGIALVHELRKREQETPVILISGVIDHVSLTETPFVAKPFDLSRLLQLVDRTLRVTVEAHGTAGRPFEDRARRGISR